MAVRTAAAFCNVRRLNPWEDSDSDNFMLSSRATSSSAGEAVVAHTGSIEVCVCLGMSAADEGEGCVAGASAIANPDAQME